MLSLSSKGQTTQAKKQDSTSAKTSEVHLFSSQKESNTSKKTAFDEGTIPTPEEQGYTKQTINGKDVYIKAVGQMILQYEPKNQ